MEERILPERLAHATVIVSVQCHRCRYDLRGQSVSGRCPECGSSVYKSVRQTLDPAASRLPVLRDPIGVGNGLVWIVGCWLLCILATRIEPVTTWIDGLTITTPGRWRIGALDWFSMIPPVLMLLSLYGAYLLSPPRHASESGAVRNDLRMLCAAVMAAAIALALLPWPPLASPRFDVLLGLPLLFVSTQILLAGASFIALLAMRNVLRVVGQRSRSYRTARGGKQGLTGLAAAVLCIVIGRMFEYIMPATLLVGRHWREWQGMGTVLVTVGYLMLVIGFVYLLVNMWWIRRALRMQPPTLDEILLPPLPADTTIIGPDDDESSFEVKAKGEP